MTTNYELAEPQALTTCRKCHRWYCPHNQAWLSPDAEETCEPCIFESVLYGAIMPEAESCPHCGELTEHEVAYLRWLKWMLGQGRGRYEG